MRHLGYALVVVVCSFAVALAAPKKKTPNPPKPDAKAPLVEKVDKKLQDELRSLDAELNLLQNKQAHFPAAKLAKKLYELQVKSTGKDSIMAEVRLQRYASALSQAGDYTGAERIYKEHVKAIEKRHGAESREVINALSAYYGIYYTQARYDDLEPIFLRLIEITRKLDGVKSKEYAQQLVSYGVLLQMRNSYTPAQRMFEQALQIHEALAPSKDHDSVLPPLQLVANLYWQMNLQAKAIAHYDRAIRIAENAKDMMVIMRLSTLWSTAMQYKFGGRKDLATPLFKRAIDMGETELARIEKATPDDWQVGSLIGQLGYMHRYNGDLAKAEQFFRRAIETAAKKGQSSGYEHSLADIKRIQGSHKEALVLLEAQRAGIEKMSPGLGVTMNASLVDILRDMGEYARAEKLLEEYRTYQTKKWGKRGMLAAYASLTGYNLYSRSGKLAKAEAALDEYLDAAERELSGLLKSGNDSDHAIYFSKNGHVLDTALNHNVVYAPKSGKAARLALTTVLRRKGRVLDAAAASLATIRAKLSKEDQKLLDELASARTQLAKLTIAGASGMDDADFAKAVATFEDKIQSLEEKVSRKSAAYRTVTMPIELPVIQKVIPKDARLVELVNYQPYDPKAPYAQLVAMQYKPRRYAAYIVGTKGDPELVELGDAATIESAIEKFRKALADPDNDQVVDLGKALYDLTFAKVVPKLGGSTNVLIAPDGALNVIPFSALVDDKREFLVKKYTFTYLTSGRDLLRLSVKTKAKGGGVLFADPQFDATDDTKAGAKNDNKTRGRRAADLGLSAFKWPQLPGTAAEADAVMKTFKGMKAYRGAAATEGTLKQVKGPEVLHLATHGFFLPDEKPAPADDSRGLGGGASAASATSAVAAPKDENPLLRSGLALAGANQLVSGDDDGLLTALEASGLDLSGTKLVVLSACETGVGKVTNGDGVYGLRRSLVIAGAESLVMSMWQVDDFATKELMAGFYKKLASGKPRSAALREVQLELASKPKYAHPFYWAAFVPAGATTPLKD